MSVRRIEFFWNTSFGRVSFKRQGARACFQLTTTDGSIKEIKDTTIDQGLIPFLMRGGRSSDLYPRVVKLNDQSYKLYLQPKLRGGMHSCSSSSHQEGPIDSRELEQDEREPAYLQVKVVMQKKLQERISRMQLISKTTDEVREKLTEYFSDMCRVESVEDIDTGQEVLVREILIKKIQRTEEGSSRLPNIFPPSLALGLLCDSDHKDKVNQAFCWGEYIRLTVSHDLKKLDIQIEDDSHTVVYGVTFELKPVSEVQFIMQNPSALDRTAVEAALDGIHFYSQQHTDAQVAQILREKVGDLYDQVEVTKKVHLFRQSREEKGYEEKFARVITLDLSGRQEELKHKTLLDTFNNKGIFVFGYHCTLENLTLAITGQSEQKELLRFAYHHQFKFRFIGSIDKERSCIEIESPFPIGKMLSCNLL